MPHHWDRARSLEAKARGACQVNSVRKEKSIERLRSALLAIEALKPLSMRSPQFRKWRRDTEVAISNTFAEKPGYVNEYTNISYSPGFYASGMSTSAFRRHYVNGLDSVAALLRSMIDEIDEYWEDDKQPDILARTSADTPDGTNEVFVVHGRNAEARKALFEFLRSIGLHPLEWSEAVDATGKPAPYVGDILDSVFSRAHAVIVLFTPDDEARLREQFRSDNDPPYEAELTGQARPNVLFEAGVAMARHQDRTILVELGALRPFSDIAGRHAVRMDNSSQRRQELAQRLEAAGCPVSLRGTDWYTAGDFENTVVEPAQAPTETIDADQGLPKEAMILLVEAANDGRGQITRVGTMGGVRIATRAREFCESGDPRSEATWIGALNALVHEGLVEDRVGKGTVFVVTDQGFKCADGLDSD